MIFTLAINNYRSILNLATPLGPLNLITGPNGSGKSNIYRALRLLAETAQGGVVQALAREGGLSSTFWAGPENVSKAMLKGEVAVEGHVRKEKKRMRMGFATDEFGYSISLGLPAPSSSAFSLDPEIKRECIWAGAYYRPASLLVDRQSTVVKIRAGRGFEVLSQHLNIFESLFNQIGSLNHTPEIAHMRDLICSWRFYDHFRTDQEAPARKAQLGTRTPVLHHDGRDVAAALQTIREIGDGDALDEAFSDAFPGAQLAITQHGEGYLSLAISQHGLLRPLSGAEFSDGTLRYILLLAALLTPRPPKLMILNEPETSLHPDLLPALARLILRFSENTQIWVVSHAERLIALLQEHSGCNVIKLEKKLGKTELFGQVILDAPVWHWPD